MHGDQEHDSAPVSEDLPIDEDTDLSGASRTRSLEETRAGFMLLDF